MEITFSQNPHWVNQDGISMVSALFAAALVAVAALTLSTLLSGTTLMQSRTQQYTLGKQVLASTAEYIQTEMVTTALDSYCTAKNAWTPNPPVVGSCTILQSGARVLNPAPLGPSSSDPKIASLLEVRRDFNGNVLASGPVCIELSQCGIGTASQLWMISMTAYWPTPDQKSLVIVPLTFRRAQ